jgi:hypothetical protein
MKYKLKYTDLFLNNELVREGSEVDLNEKEAEKLKTFLVKVDNTKPVSESSKAKKNNKTKNN